jgi:cytochrome c oxidase assembly protein subunit 15
MSLPKVAPAHHRTLAIVTLIALAAIVVTGGAVRLTSSGLGCPAWPRCTAHSLTAAASFHPMVEFANRVISALVGFVVGATVLASLLRRPLRRDLVWLALGLFGGFVAQAVIGGLSVIYHLSPPWVMAHFLVSMLLLWDGYLLVEHSASTAGRGIPVVRREVLFLRWVVTVAAAAVLVLGTFVTGSGPNSGAPVVRRLPFDLRSVAQLHSDLVLFLIGVVVALIVVLRVVDAPAAAQRRSWVLLAIMVGQAAIGFTQFFLGLAHARALVEVHIAGATLFWLATLWLGSALYERPAEELAVPAAHLRLAESQGA